ncbi:LCP family protein [Streptococcus acidominimus]|uniref:LCP family protein n=1 Tax=Streptococcus acidominimus TaxID=1326 RepID=UPI001F594932|nr:LCP family protein [Streptococcus acidominimus]
MTRYESTLTHHEELRLDYLRKNIHYLNDREQRELAYLERKLRGDVLPSSRSAYRRRRPVEREEWEEWEEAPEDFLDLEMEPEGEILPVYPRQKKKKPKERPIKQPKIRKKKKGRLKRLFLLLLLGLISLFGALIFMFAKGMNGVEQKASAEVFNGQATNNGVNILILGTDGRVGDSSDMTRTDSIMVLNINNKDKKAKLVSFMRDTLIDIDGADYKLNLAYTFGEQNAHKGAENVREVLKENFDINIQYYALVDFSTFATAIDTLFPEGVTIDAKFGTVDGQEVSSVEVPDDLHMENGSVPNQTIPVGLQKMNGATLLNYARFRKDDEADYGRTKRQQQVLAAILTQAKNPMKLFSGAEALGKAYALTSTNIPQSFLVTSGSLVLLDAKNGVEQTTIPTMGDWIDEYDIYGGLGIKIDFEKYQRRLSELGLR